MGTLINEVGNVHGYLTVIERAPNKDGRAMWKCRCKCGNEVVVLGKHLRSGNTKSCGCYQKERAIQSNMDRVGSLVGQKIGKLQVLEEVGFITRASGKRNRVYKCLCDCGNYCEIQHTYLACGDTISCGCIRSKGEFQIEQLLKEHNIKYKKEYSFEDLIDKLPLRFDFAILNDEEELICLIEFQGKQYYDKNNGFYSEDLVKHDKIKQEYCKEGDIPLIIIDYKRDHDITWEELESKLEEYIHGL